MGFPPHFASMFSLNMPCVWCNLKVQQCLTLGRVKGEKGSPSSAQWCTHCGPLPDEGNRWLFTEEERGVAGREVGVLEEDPLAQALLLQLLVGLPRAVGGTRGPGQCGRPRLRVPVQVRHGSLLPARETSQGAEA